MISLILALAAVVLVHAGNLNSNPGSQPSGFARSSQGSGQIPLEQGFYNLTELSSGIGLSEIDIPYSGGFGGITTVNGYSINKTLKAGVGTGILFYNGGTVLPLYLDGRVYLGSGRLRPYLSGAGGALFRVGGEEASTRLFANPGIGLQIPMGIRSSLSLTAGLKSQLDQDKLRDSFATLKVGMMLW